MTLVACGLLALGVLAFMIIPMLEGSSSRPWISRTAWSAWSRRDDLLKKKDFIYSSIRELNIDYSMGKLAAEDHEALRQEYMKEASDVLDELDRTAGADLPVEEQIEKAVLENRQRRDPVAAAVDSAAADRKTVPGTTATDTAAADRKTDHARSPASERTQVCGDCGTANDPSANFCIECGISLISIRCKDCGTGNPASARFCAQCGEKLT